MATLRNRFPDESTEFGMSQDFPMDFPNDFPHAGGMPIVPGQPTAPPQSFPTPPIGEVDFKSPEGDAPMSTFPTLDPGPQPDPEVGRRKVQPVPTVTPNAPQAAPQPQAPQDFGHFDAPVLPSHADLDARLKSLFESGGGFNQDIVNRRTENAAENLRRQRKSTLNNDKAYLADRGLIGSGPEATALETMDQNIADQYKNAVSGIYSNESQAADSRMMQALQMATGLSQSDAQNIIAAWEGSTARGLGLGNLALGNMNGQNSFNLGLGRLGLDRDLGMAGIDNAHMDQLIQLIHELMNGAQVSAGGHF